MWNNEYIVGLIAQNRNTILPVVFGALYTNSRKHWNSTVHGLTCNVVKLFMEMDSTLFDKCKDKYTDWVNNKEHEALERREKLIDDITEAAKKADTFERAQFLLLSDTPMCRPSDLPERDAPLDLKSGSALSSRQPSCDALRRKSAIPHSK